MIHTDSYDELETACLLASSPVSALELHQEHERRLKSLRKWLISELTEKTNEAPTFTIVGPGRPSNEEFVELLIDLVNEQRVQKRLEPLSILW